MRLTCRAADAVSSVRPREIEIRKRHRSGEFSGHGTVNHSAEEYVRAAFWHTNTVENFFSIFKRGIYGGIADDLSSAAERTCRRRIVSRRMDGRDAEASETATSGFTSTSISAVSSIIADCDDIPAVGGHCCGSPGGAGRAGRYPHLAGGRRPDPG